MEILLLICVGLLLILGIIGSVLPVLPGPLMSYIALLVYHFCVKALDFYSLIWIGIAVVAITGLDYFLQIYGVQKAGGGKFAIRCSVVGMLLGIFLFPPFGIVAGAFIGAFVGAKIEMEKNPVQIAFGALWGFIIGTVLKLCFSIYVVYYLLF